MSASGGLRIGHGIDAHRLVPGRRLLLGCVEIPFDLGLEGHSDGDVAAHALGSALLGGAGLGDLGRHFPSDDERWRDLSGRDLLARVASLLSAAGWVLESGQVVVLAERPRLAPHLSAMARAMAEALGVEPGRLQVGVSSTDGLGFVGRLDGILASSVVLLRSVS